MNLNLSLHRLLVLAATVLFVVNASHAQAPMPHRSIWGSTQPASATVTAEMHLEYWCPPMTLIHYCTIQVTLDVGDDACAMCEKLAAVINSDPCCIAYGYVATCDEVELVVEGTFTSCPGGWLCFDPAGVFALRKSTDMTMIDVTMPLYLSLFGDAGGVSVKPGAQAGALVIFTAHYPNETEGRAFLVEVPTAPGMSAAALAQAIHQGFVSQGLDEVTLEGTKVKFNPPTEPPAPLGPTLDVRVSSQPSSESPCATVEVWAKWCDGAFGLAAASFDVLLEGGAWSNLQTYPTGFLGAFAGTADASGVHSIVVGQTHDAGLDQFPDFANPLLVWSGQWCPPDNAKPCTPVSTKVGFLDVFADPAGAIVRCESVESDSTWVALNGTTCQVFEPGAVDVLFFINDTSMNYVLASSPTLLCQIDGLYCEDTCSYPSSPVDSCFVAQSGPACEDAECCVLICGFDAFCCAVAWDGVCADAASVLCIDPVPGDFNGDGFIDGADLGVLLSGWNQPGPTDLDGNGVTDGADLGVLLSGWSPGTP